MKVLGLGTSILLSIVIVSSQAGAQIDEDLGVEAPFCHRRLAVAGEEMSSRGRAQRAAEEAWIGRVRHDYGERYMDLNHVKDVRLVCAVSSVSAILKRAYFRCKIWATPCEVPSAPLEELLVRPRRFPWADDE